MNCCDFNPIVKQSEEGAIYTKKLRFYLYIYLFFSLLRTLTIPTGEFLYEMIIGFFIFLMSCQLSFYYGMFVILFLLFQLFFEILTLLTYLQAVFLLYTSIHPFVIIIQSCIIIIYIMLTKWTFICYKEYKALFYEQNGSGFGMGYTQMRDEEQGYGNPNYNNYNNYNYGYNNNNNNNNEERKAFVPFTGRGTTWG